MLQGAFRITVKKRFPQRCEGNFSEEVSAGMYYFIGELLVDLLGEFSAEKQEE